MSSRVRQIVNSVASAVRRPWQLWQRPHSGRFYAYDPAIDSMRDDLTKKLTFSKLATLLRNSDDGDITDALELFEDMEKWDPRLASVAETRRRAVSGLPYEIVSAADVRDDVKDKKLAEESAGFVREQFDSIPDFDIALEHLSDAIGPNLAVLEQVWEDGRIVEAFEIPSERLTMDLTKSTDIRVLTAEHQVNGIVAKSPKFVVHIPKSTTRSPIAKSLTRAQATIWLVKRLALADWAAFVEIFGLPVRVGRYTGQPSSSEKAAMVKMLKNIGSNAWAMISEGMQIDFVEATNRGVSPHQAIMNYCSREQSILWLGGNLTSDTTGGTGTFAAADVQDELRGDLRDDDIRREARTLREQIIRPMVEIGMARMNVPLPYFQRVTPETIDRIKEAVLIDKSQRIGLDVSEDGARKRLGGIPKPQEGDTILKPPDAFAEGLTEGFGEEGT